MSRAVALTLLTALALALLAGNAVWLARDTQPLPSTDAYEYLRLLVEALDDDGPTRGWRQRLAAMSQGGRPPLYQLATAPLLHLIGPSADAGVAVNLPFLVLLLIATYALGTAIAGRGTGLLAAFLVVTAPPVIHLSRTYRPKFAQIALVALALWLLVRLLERRRPRDAIAFGGVLALGLSIHPTFAWSILMPTAVFGTLLLLAALRRGPLAGSGSGVADDRRLVIRGLVPAALLAAAPLLLWYAGGGRRILDLYRSMLSGELLSYRGYRYHAVGFDQPEGSPWWYLLTAPGALGLVVCALFALGLIALAVRRPARAAAWVPAVAALGALLLLTVQTTRAWMLAAAALPAVAVVAACGATAFRHRPLRAVLVAAALAGGVAAYAIVTWGAPSWARPAARLLAGGENVDAAGCRHFHGLCASPARAAAWPVRAILDTAYQAGDCDRRAPGPACRMLIVNAGGLNAKMFQFENAVASRRKSLLVRGQGNAKWSTERYPLAALLGSDFVLWVPEVPRPGRARRSNYRAATQGLLDAPPPAFARGHRELASFALPNGKTAVLLGRTAPPSAEEARQVHEALDLHPRHKPDWRRAVPGTSS